jgi:hypothetical protein
MHNDEGVITCPLVGMRSPFMNVLALTLVPGSVQVDVSALPAGLYLLRVADGEVVRVVME